MYPHKCTLKKFKKKYQEKWENGYLIVKNARASTALSRPWTPANIIQLASLAPLTLLRYVGKISEKNSGAPP